MVKLNKDFLKKITFKNIKADFFGLFSGITIKEVLLFLVFPISIILLMLLPENIKGMLSFNIDDASWWQFITHAFIHHDFNHLWDNLNGFLIFGIILFIFSNKAGDKRNLALLFFFTLVSLPLISSVIEISIYPTFMHMIKTSQGSSGLVSAILGFLPMLWIFYLSKRQKHNLLTLNFFNLCGLYVALLFVFIYYPIHKNISYILVVVAFTVLIAFLNRKHFKLMLKGVLEESKDNIIFYFLMILIPLFFMIAPLLLFPVKLVQGNSLVDFFMHYIGLIYGLIISFIFLKWKLSKLTDNKTKLPH